MKLQNTDTTNRLNTLPQTKNTVPSSFASIESCARNSGMNTHIPTITSRYTIGTKIRRGKRATSAPNSGASASVTTNVTR